MLNTIFDILSEIFAIIYTLISEVGKTLFNIKPKRKETLDADFLNLSEVLSRYNKGFNLTGTHKLTTKDSYTSCLVLGASGSGKTVSVAIPTIYNLAQHGHSICVHDPSGELKSASAGRLVELGYKVVLLHYSKPEISDGFNFLSRAKTDSDIQKIASLLVRSALGNDSKDPFWSNQAIMLITLIVKLLKREHKQFQNLANAKYLLDSMASKPESLDIMVAKIADKEILNEYKIFAAMDKKLFSSIVATCRSALMIFGDKNVQQVTSFDSINFESLRKEKVAIFIQNPTGDTKYYSTLSAIFFEQLFSSFMENLPENNEKSVFLILDEASSLFLPSLQIALANLRKYRVGTMLVGQDMNQFIHLYGSYEAEAIKTNCWSKVYFPGQPMHTCQELERQLGVFEFTDENGHRKNRHLMTADEIRTMEKNTSLILTGSNRAIFSRMKPYFRHFTYRRFSSLAQPKAQCKVPYKTQPIINIPTSL